MVDNCAICRNHIMDLCELLRKQAPLVFVADSPCRHRVSSKPSVSHQRRVHSCMGHLQCKSSLVAPGSSSLLISVTACFPFPLHFKMAQGSFGVSFGQSRLGVPEVRPLMFRSTRRNTRGPGASCFLAPGEMRQLQSFVLSERRATTFQRETVMRIPTMTCHSS